MLIFENKKKQYGIWKAASFSSCFQFFLVSPPSPCFLLVCVCCVGVASSLLAPARSPHLLTSISSAAAKGIIVSRRLIARLFHQQLWYQLSGSLIFLVLTLVHYSYMYLLCLDRQCQLHVQPLFLASGLDPTLLYSLKSKFYRIKKALYFSKKTSLLLHVFCDSPVLHNYGGTRFKVKRQIFEIFQSGSKWRTD